MFLGEVTPDTYYQIMKLPSVALALVPCLIAEAAPLSEIESAN